jgi:hypothetical protein
MKDAKHIFTCAIDRSEAMIVDRILVRVLPSLMAHGQMLTADDVKNAEQLPVSDELYDHIRAVAEELVGIACTKP